MQPDENAQSGNFHRTLANQIEAPDTHEILGRDIDAPYHSARSNQASQALFSRNDEERPPFTLGLSGRLRDGSVDGLLRQIQIGFAPPVPAGISRLMIFVHNTDNDTRVSRVHITEVWSNHWPVCRLFQGLR